MQKIIVTQDSFGNREEHPHKSFKEISKEFAGQDLTAYIDLYKETESGALFVKSERIGSFLYPLDRTDYWSAYDKLIN